MIRSVIYLFIHSPSSHHADSRQVNGGAEVVGIALMGASFRWQIEYHIHLAVTGP